MVGTLQPLNAFVRPHPFDEQGNKTTARRVWEIVHKGLGWCAVVAGMINVVVGILLIRQKSYDELTVMLPTVLAALSISSIGVALLFHFAGFTHNPIALSCATTCVGAEPSEDQDSNFVPLDDNA